LFSVASSHLPSPISHLPSPISRHVLHSSMSSRLNKCHNPWMNRSPFLAPYPSRQTTQAGGLLPAAMAEPHHVKFTDMNPVPWTICHQHAAFLLAPCHAMLYHVRFNRVVADFNGTRSSDVFVVNFGVHYHDTPEHDQEYRDAVFPILDQMAEVGKTATVIWRYEGGRPTPRRLPFKDPSKRRQRGRGRWRWI